MTEETKKVEGEEEATDTTDEGAGESESSDEDEA